MRRHKDPSRRQLKASRRKTPKQKTTQAEDNPSGRHPKRKTTQAQKTPATPTAATTATSTGALHPIGGGAPVTWRCTRTEEVHCLRIGCTAPTHKNKRGTGTPNHSPPHPSMRTWALLAAGWAHRPRHHLHSGPLRHLLHPYMRRAGKDTERAGARRRREKRSARPGAGQGPASGRWPTGRRSDRTRPR